MSLSPAVRILLALVVGLAAGAAAAGSGAAWLDGANAVAATVGGLWLDALKMTVVPLIVALLVSGINGGVHAANAGGVAGRSALWFAGIIMASAVLGALLMPLLLQVAPLPRAAADALRAGLGAVDIKATAAAVPTASEFLRQAVPTNVIAAAANDKILQLVLFTSVFAFALTRIDPGPRERLAGYFDAIAAAMLVMIGWVLWLAPLGVFGLAFTVGASAGSAAFGAILHYIVLVSSLGGLIIIAAYGVALFGARLPPGRFARAMIAPQAVAISTQSSLASLPAMLAASKALGIAEHKADVTLPLAVALFRATGPAMNIAVAIYVAQLMGVELGPLQLAAGVAVAATTTLGAVSLPGQLSFVTSIAPIALAMGIPIEPLALLIAVETIPDIFRTLGNVTMDVAVTGAAACGKSRDQRPEISLTESA